MWHGGGAAEALNVLDDHPWTLEDVDKAKIRDRFHRVAFLGKWDLLRYRYYSYKRKKYNLGFLAPGTPTVFLHPRLRNIA